MVDSPDLLEKYSYGRFVQSVGRDSLGSFTDALARFLQAIWRPADHHDARSLSMSKARDGETDSRTCAHAHDPLVVERTVCLFCFHPYLDWADVRG